jgi:hypothetical protein
MPARKQDRKHDQAVEDSFPASDPPATTGIVGPGTDRRERGSRQAPHERDDDARPKGTPTHDRHAAETAYQWEHEKSPQKR